MSLAWYRDAMSPVAKAAIAAGGLLAGGLLASTLLRKNGEAASARRQNPFPRTASDGRGCVGAVPSPCSGTRDWWTDRNHRRRKKHLRMMTAKG